MRISFSLLDAFQKGRIDDAVNIYLHLDKEETEAIKEGKRLHQEFSDYINKEGKLPEWAGNFTLTSPKSEHKEIVSYNDMFDLSAVFDVLDTPNLYELKTGKTDISSYVSSYQLSMYFLVARLASLPVERAYLIHLNQHSDYCEFCVVWNNDEHIKRAENFIETIGGDVYSYFSEHNLIK